MENNAKPRRRHLLYSLFEHRWVNGKLKWVRISTQAHRKHIAVRVFQNQLLVGIYYSDPNAQGPRSLRPVTGRGTDECCKGAL